MHLLTGLVTSVKEPRVGKDGRQWQDVYVAAGETTTRTMGSDGPYRVGEVVCLEGVFVEGFGGSGVCFRRGRRLSAEEFLAVAEQFGRDGVR